MAAIALLLRAALRVRCHIACTLNCPFVILFEEQGSDEPAYGLLIGEDADDVGSPLDFADGPLDGVGESMSA